MISVSQESWTCVFILNHAYLDDLHNQRPNWQLSFAFFMSLISIYFVASLQLVDQDIGFCGEYGKNKLLKSQSQVFRSQEAPKET